MSNICLRGHRHLILLLLYDKMRNSFIAFITCALVHIAALSSVQAANPASKSMDVKKVVIDKKSDNINLVQIDFNKIDLNKICLN